MTLNLPPTVADVVRRASESPVTVAEAPVVVPKSNGTVTIDGDKVLMDTEYDAALVERQRGIPGRQYVGGSVNAFPIERLPEVVELATEFGVEVPADVLDQVERVEQLVAVARAEEAERTEASHATDSDLTIAGLGGTLRPFQRAGVAYAARTRRTFIADEMGLGKTVQALATAEYLDAFPLVIVVPATLKVNWQRETTRWLPSRSSVIVSGRKCDPDAIEGFDVVIVNYDVLDAWAECLGNPRGLILDESHYVKSPTAKRTKAATSLAKRVPKEGMVLLLSGTPILNRADELVAQLRVLGRLAEFGNAKQFRFRYCEWDGFGYRGSKNLNELHDRLRASCFVRRTKTEVLSELPPKVRQFLPVEGSAAAMSTYRDAEHDLIEFVRNRAAFLAELVGDDPEVAAREKAAATYRAEAIVRLTTLRRLAGLAKVEGATRYIEDTLEENGKIVVFAHHREVIEALAAAFDAPVIIGGQSDVDRQAAVDAFQNDPEVRVLVSSIKAGGVGITLTAASVVLLVEQDWTAAGNDQAEDRLHRIGQTDSVFAVHMHAVGTVDERVAELVEEKRGVMDATLDGKTVDSYDESSITSDVLATYA